MDPAAIPPKPPALKPLPERPASPGAAPRRPLLGRTLLGRRTPSAPAAGAAKSAAGVPAGRPALVSLSWANEDIENRWGIFKGGRYTSVNKALTFILAAAVSAGFLALMEVLYHRGEPFRRIGEFLVRPNNLVATIPATMCFFWGVVTVTIKFPKLALQRRALDLAAVPQHHDFVLSESTARTVLERMRSLVDDTKYFILLNRIDRALSSLHNIGGISDVSTILKSQADNDENQIASSYALVNAMIWSIPVLGFVGTVFGLSLAIRDFTDALGGTRELSQITESLKHVTAGLGTAFETTLVGLVFALLLHLYSDLMQQKETDFLDECNDYCHAHVVSKLRVRREEPPPQ